ncbi:YehS family protein [Ferrimonas marina]|uniref:Uncharacterized conserved protein YehS, DUF1456 family n=1 Tax=Ferrimonas marina TaxID=299255 RepID=A0A1M5Y188_9GAMM|nr:DUF1456 family protein [Ferrimonas marina]SHI05835.1 Uncharacterized conserved protein YehS, DUF1456 family [Ferrimonas marina]
MLNNDLLRQLRYALKMNNPDVIEVFTLMNYPISKEELDPLLKKEEEAGFIPCRDRTLAAFLDGLIIKHRGVQEGREPQLLPAKSRLSNNDILRKLRIALTLKDEDIIAILALSNFRISKSELSALFRKPDHRNYQPCGDQLLRNFVRGLGIRNRAD